MFTSLSYVWLAAAVVLFIIEAAVPGLISLWFGIGALIAAVAALLKAPFWLQVAVFAAGSLITLILTRPLVKKYVNSKVQPTNADAVIGKECIVTERIDNINGTGAVKVWGKVWTAISYDGIVIDEGCRAIVREIRGVKLVVEPLNARLVQE